MSDEIKPELPANVTEADFQEVMSGIVQSIGVFSQTIASMKERLDLIERVVAHRLDRLERIAVGLEIGNEKLGLMVELKKREE